ncbi:EscU/YscU/HrcU family type III secretion system export apparatus switch protein [Halanaerocella petrolearia]
MKKEKEEAVALKYDINQDQAPKVVAKGQGSLAKEIINKAEEHDIAIEEDKDLVEVLLQLELGEEIPEELYQVIAEILSFVFGLEDLT